MTIQDIKEMHKDYAVEVYRASQSKPDKFHTDNCSLELDYNDLEEVLMWELMDEYDYNHSILANVGYEDDFGVIYGDKQAKILCIMIGREKSGEVNNDEFYLVTLTETLCRTVKVPKAKADTIDNAEDLVRELYHKADIILDSDDFCEPVEIEGRYVTDEDLEFYDEV